MNTAPTTGCAAWSKLAALARAAGGIAKQPLVAEGPGLRLDYSRQRVNAAVLAALAQLARERGFDDWRAALLAGEKINVTENRAAWHTALRAGEAAPKEVKETLARILALASKIRSGKKFKRIVSLGTGGSDLGPRLLADAFGDGTIDVRFVASADPLELERALAGASPASTLFIVVSKTFTTQETMANAAAARRWGGRTFYATTANLAAARAFGADEVLPTWDWVGGRYSIWSAVSLAAACAVGPDTFGTFLEGGRDMDAHFRDAPIEKNLPALLALLGVWNINFLDARAHAVLPYAHRLRLLPAYLQQLEMESNGKRVDREGRAVSYATAPVVWGAEGTPSQHSFHQLLHQGSQAVPVDFIDPGVDAVLSANARAQADALAMGNRPSSTLALDGLDARGLGRLIALYEHKVFTQGVIWNVNSFDQPGVELGKQLAKQILEGGK